MSWQHWMLLVLMVLNVPLSLFDDDRDAEKVARDILGAILVVMLLVWGQQ